MERWTCVCTTAYYIASALLDLDRDCCYEHWRKHLSPRSLVQVLAWPGRVATYLHVRCSRDNAIIAE